MNYILITFVYHYVVINNTRWNARFAALCIPRTAPMDTTTSISTSMFNVFFSMIKEIWHIVRLIQDDSAGIHEFRWTWNKINESFILVMADSNTQHAQNRFGLCKLGLSKKQAAIFFAFLFKKRFFEFLHIFIDNCRFIYETRI